DIEDARDNGNEQARLTLDIFRYHVAKYIGSYAAAMNGVDAIVFTAGLGENDPLTREEVCSYLGFMGVEFDSSVNNFRGEERVISTPDSKVKVLCVPTNEELMIARDTVALV
ncbi:MAG: acetate kinase, partial [Clostridiales bacterium]|nr:acetate kinase [Clostridiales bacterium]